MSDMDVLHELVRMVSRYFYDAKCIVLFEFLLHFKIMSDEDLADRMRMVLKDVNRTAARLREDKLLKSEARQETRPSDLKLVTKTYYYIDFKLFVDVVKYKMYMMKRGIEDLIKNELDNKGYKCPKCKKTYAALELQSLMDARSMAFECEICGAEIEEHAEDPEKVKATQETLSRLMEQTAPLIRLLKKTEDIVIPLFNPVEFLRQRQAMASLSAANEAAGDGKLTANPEIGASTASATKIRVQIDEQEPSKVIHELPSWHTHSTVTYEQIVASPLHVTQTDATSTVSLTLTTESEAIQQYYNTLQSTSSTSLPIKRALEEIEAEEAASEPEEELMVTIGGITKPLSQVTDEDKAAMTPDEYAAYYEVYMASLQ